MLKHLESIGERLYLYTIKQAKHHFQHLHDMDTQSEKAMYQILVTDPIREIIKDLNGPFTYRVDFLNSKLQSCMEVAAQTAGISPSLVREERQPEIKNEHAKAYFLKYFQLLLQHFEKWT